MTNVIKTNLKHLTYLARDANQIPKRKHLEFYNIMKTEKLKTLPQQKIISSSSAAEIKLSGVQQ